MEVTDSEYLPSQQKKSKPSKKKIKKEEEYENETDEDKKTTRKPKEPKTWVCKKCSAVCETRKALTEHNKIHTIRKSSKDETPTFRYDEEQEVYYCDTCSQEFSTEEQVQFHIVKFHEEHFICEICNHVAKKAYLFAIHMKEHSKDDMFYCPLCSYSSLRRTCLNSHINIVHYHKFSYNCPTCNKGFNDPLLFKEHDNEHLGIKPFVCIVCSKEFVYSRYMTQHQIRHHTVYIQGTLHKTQCSICLKVFSNPENLLKHITTKHKFGEDKVERPNLCDLCGKGFRTPIKLKLHYRIHTGEKPYACKFCGKCFSKKDYLVMHERVHTGEKPYSCEYCGKGFNQVAPLRIHVRGHTGERPYLCQFCHNGYISRGSLNLHMKTCSGIRSFST